MAADERDDNPEQTTRSMPGVGKGRKSGEMSDERAAVGDAPVPMPPGGSATQGAAQGVGMSRSGPDLGDPGSADPGAGSATTGDDGMRVDRGDDPANAGLGGSDAGGRLEDFDRNMKS